MPFMTHALNNTRAAIATPGLVCLTAAPAAAQWLTIALQGTPRTPDGKPA